MAEINLRCGDTRVKTITLEFYKKIKFHLITTEYKVYAVLEEKQHIYE